MKLGIRNGKETSRFVCVCVCGGVEGGVRNRRRHRCELRVLFTLAQDRSKKIQNCGDGIWDLWVTEWQVPSLSSATVKTPSIQCGSSALPVDDDRC